MRRIDGKQGEGGGQILRTSLSLSMVTGEPFRIEDIRAARRKPGLLRQHLAAVKASAAVSHASVEGAELGSTALTFKPGQVRAGDYTFPVGSAGSGTLVLQTVLPALMTAQGPSTVTVEGGTHNPLAPPFDFLAKTFLPQLKKLGVAVELQLERAGFYPSGGGRFRASIAPAPQLGGLELLERGAVEEVYGKALVAGLPLRIAERECIALREALGLERTQLRAEQFEGATGPGNVVMVEVRSKALTELFIGFGEKGRPAEEVAKGVAAEAKEYLRGDAPVGEHLADQLLLPMALGQGGRFRAQRLSEHARTQMALVQDWLGVRMSVRGETANSVTIEVTR